MGSPSAFRLDVLSIGQRRSLSGFVSPNCSVPSVVSLVSNVFPKLAEIAFGLGKKNRSRAPAVGPF